MRRSGTTLVEVLVASVLLAVGISGCLSTLAVAARFRERAAAREELAAAAQHRIGWFLSRGCAHADTSGSASDARLDQTWTFRRDSVGARIELDLTRRTPLVDERLTLAVDHPC
jgi:Tfp pilus assembly protein PilV